MDIFFHESSFFDIIATNVYLLIFGIAATQKAYYGEDLV